jgi:uncharacterized protein (UPF0216 family)
MLELTNDIDIDIPIIKNRLLEISSILSEHSISKNRKAFMAHTITDEVIKERQILVKEQKALEQILIKNKKHITESDSKDTLWKSTYNDVLFDSLGKSNLNLLRDECLRRIQGKEPSKITLFGISTSLQSDKDEIKRLRKMLEENNKKMQEARKSIDRFISANEPDVNKADYIRSVSEINKCLPPLQELQKVKI